MRNARTDWLPSVGFESFDHPTITGFQNNHALLSDDCTRNLCIQTSSVAYSLNKNNSSELWCVFNPPSGPVGRTEGRASQKIIVLVMEIWAKMEANQAKTRASASQPQKPEVCSSRNQHEKSAFPSAWPPPFRLETTERLSWQRDYHLPLNFYCKRLAGQIDNVWDGRWQGTGVMCEIFASFLILGRVFVPVDDDVK